MSEAGILAHFFSTRDQYRGNAEEAIRRREYRKASELLWGAITQQLKALAALSNITIGQHREFFAFLRQYAAEISDETLYLDFVSLNALHRNFYDEIIPPDAFPSFYEIAITYLERLEGLIKQRIEAKPL